MGWLDDTWNDAYSLGGKLPKDPAGTPGFTGDSSNPLDFITGKSTLGPEKASTQNLTDAMNRAFGLSDQLAAERAGYGTHYNPNYDEWYTGRQMDNIRGLQDIVTGKTASPAEMQLREQAARNAQGAYGQAAALQGRNPGAALRAALDTAFKTNSDANIQAAIQRSRDQQAAQQALVQAIGGARGQNQNLLAADNDWLGKLLNAQVASNQTGEKAAGDQFDAENKNMAAQNQFNADLGSSIVKGVFKSDERAKTDIVPADLDSLADSLKGFRFRYKDAKDGSGERIGIMAQDALKGGPAGERMVKKGGDGALRIDIGNAVGAALAMSAKALRETRAGA